MNTERFFKKISAVDVPSRYALSLQEMSELKTLMDKPVDLACAAFSLGFLRSQQASAAAARARTRQELERHAPGYGLLVTILERHMEDESFIRWMLIRARNLDKEG